MTLTTSMSTSTQAKAYIHGFVSFDFLYLLGVEMCVLSKIIPGSICWEDEASTTQLARSTVAVTFGNPTLY